MNSELEYRMDDDLPLKHKKKSKKSKRNHDVESEKRAAEHSDLNLLNDITTSDLPFDANDFVRKKKKKKHKKEENVLVVQDDTNVGGVMCTEDNCDTTTDEHHIKKKKKKKKHIEHDHEELLNAPQEEIQPERIKKRQKHKVVCDSDLLETAIEPYDLVFPTCDDVPQNETKEFDFFPEPSKNCKKKKKKYRELAFDAYNLTGGSISTSCDTTSSNNLKSKEKKSHPDEVMPESSHLTDIETVDVISTSEELSAKVPKKKKQKLYHDSDRKYICDINTNTGERNYGNENTVDLGFIKNNEDEHMVAQEELLLSLENVDGSDLAKRKKKKKKKDKADFDEAEVIPHKESLLHPEELSGLELLSSENLDSCDAPKRKKKKKKKDKDLEEAESMVQKESLLDVNLPSSKASRKKKKDKIDVEQIEVAPQPINVTENTQEINVKNSESTENCHKTSKGKSKQALESPGQMDHDEEGYCSSSVLDQLSSECFDGKKESKKSKSVLKTTEESEIKSRHNKHKKKSKHDHHNTENEDTPAIRALANDLQDDQQHADYDYLPKDKAMSGDRNLLPGTDFQSISYTKVHKRKRKKAQSEKPVLDLNTSDDITENEALSVTGMSKSNDNEDPPFTSLMPNIVDYPVDFEVPVLHASEKIAPLSKDKKKELSEMGVTIHEGKWTKKETDLLVRNWNNFIHHFKISDPVSLLGINRGAKKKEFTEFIKSTHFYLYLAKDLGHRTLHSVYRKARLMFDPNKTATTLDHEEVSNLKRVHAMVGNKWSLISNMMDKQPTKIQSSFRSHRNNQSKGSWSEEEEQKLKDAVHNVAGESVRELSFRPINISWSDIAKQVGTRNEFQCRHHWLRVVGWTVKKSKQLKWDKMASAMLIYILYKNNNGNDSSSFDWPSIFPLFRYYVPSYLALNCKWNKMLSKYFPISKKKMIHSEQVTSMFQHQLVSLLGKLGISLNGLDDIIAARRQEALNI